MPGFRERAQQDRRRAAGDGREAAEGEEEEVSQRGQGHHCGVNKRCQSNFGTSFPLPAAAPRKEEGAQ